MERRCLVNLDGSSATYNAGGCIGGCTDETACNYDADAVLDYDDGSCISIADGECDCDGNVDGRIRRMRRFLCKPTPMQMAFATTWMTVLVPLMSAVCATATTLLVLDATVSQAAASNSTIAVCVAVTTAAAQVAWMKRPATMTQTRPFKGFVTGDMGSLQIDLTAGSWPGEISWTLNGEFYGAPASESIDLAPGLYTISGNDSVTATDGTVQK